jgi:hypothetical protein
MEEDKSMNYVFCKSEWLNEIHDFSSHVCKQTLIFLVFKYFLFSQTDPSRMFVE